MQRQPSVKWMEQFLSWNEKKSEYVAAGVAGLGFIGSSDLCSRLLDAAPPVFDGAFLTADLVAAGFVALAYVGFRSEGKRLIRIKEDEGLSDSDPAPACFDRIGFKGLAYRLGLLLLVGAGLLLLVGAWWGIADPEVAA